MPCRALGMLRLDPVGAFICHPSFQAAALMASQTNSIVASTSARSTVGAAISQTQEFRSIWSGADFAGVSFSVSQHVPWDVRPAVQASTPAQLASAISSAGARVSGQQLPVQEAPVETGAAQTTIVASVTAPAAGLRQSAVSDSAHPAGARSLPVAQTTFGAPQVAAPAVLHGPTPADLFEQELHFCLRHAPALEPRHQVQEGVDALRALPGGVACSLMMRYQLAEYEHGGRRWFGAWAVAEAARWHRNRRIQLAEIAGA